LTTYELARYQRELEHAIKGITAGAPVQADLRGKLAEVLAEQDERARLNGVRDPCGSGNGSNVICRGMSSGAERTHDGPLPPTDSPEALSSDTKDLGP